MIGFIRRLPTLVRGHWGAFLLVAALFLATSAFESALLPLVIQVLIDDVLTPRNATLLLPLLGGVVGAAVVYCFVAIGRDVLHARLGERLLAGVRERLYVRLQRQSVGFHAKTATPTLVAHFTTDLSAVEQSLASGIPWALTGTLGLCISSALLFTLEWKLALLAMAGLALSTAGPWLLGGRALRASRRVREEQAQFAARVHEDLAAHQTVLAFGMQGSLLERFRRNLGNYLALSTRAQILGALVERTPNLTMLAFNMGILVVGSLLVFRGDMSIGSLVSFYALSTGLSASVGGITWSHPYFIAADSGLGRIDDALAEEVSVADRSNSGEASPLADGIELDRVTFGYSAERPNLREVSLRVPRNSYCAFVGPSGSGKSTVLNLVLRFFDAQDGSVRWDGRDVRELTQASLRGQMAVVFQDNVVFRDTVRANLRVGKADATDDEMRVALADAELLDLVNKLPSGLDTMLGEGGVRLSGGQRQRLAIARALLRNPSVLVLDEATSALDPATEAAVNETVQRVGRTRTVLSVTHRLSSTTSADSIFVLDGGKLVEHGTHDELLRKGSLYAQLWAKQSGFGVSAEGDWATVEASRLKQLPLLAGLATDILELLAQQFQPEIYPAGREVVHQGDPGDRFFIVARGDLEVIADDAGGPRRIATLRDGDYFGETALLYDQPRSATVRTLAPSVLLSLRRRPFLALLQTRPDLRAQIERESQRRQARVA